MTATGPVIGAIDSLSNHFTPENLKRNFLSNPTEVAAFERLGLMDNLRGKTPDAFLSHMTDAGVDKVVVTAISSWSYLEQRMNVFTSVGELVEARKADPARINGLFGINPMERTAGVRAMEEAMRTHGFVGAHLHPHGYDMPPDHAFYFPYYAKCAELGVPVVISMGHTLDMMPIEVGRPVYLDKIALYFPELKILCAHTAWPWVEEAIALAAKHPNVYIGTSAYAPKYWPQTLVQFADTRGQRKVLWGTDFPVIDHARALREIDALQIKPQTRQRLLRDNAMEFFPFDRPAMTTETGDRHAK